MKRGKYLLVGVMLFLIISIAAQNLDVGLDVKEDSKGNFYSILINPFFKFLEFIGLAGDSECETGYGLRDCPEKECHLLVDCVNGECVYEIMEVGSECDEDKVCDWDGTCTDREIFEAEWGEDECGCAGESYCENNNVVYKTASCNLQTKGCEYRQEVVECGLCETCGKVDYSELYSQFENLEEGLITEKPSLSGAGNAVFLMDKLSMPFGILSGFSVVGMIAMFGQVGVNEDPLAEDTIWIPLIPSPFGEEGFEVPYIQPTCIPNEECEKEKKICAEYSNKKIADLYCDPQKYPEKYTCSRDARSLCKTNNFVIKEINGIDSNTALQECCQWAWKLEYEKCKQESDLAMQYVAKYKFKGGDYQGRRLTGYVVINLQENGNPSSISSHTGWTNEIIFNGDREEIAKDLIPGDVATFVINKGFVNEPPPWLYKGLSYAFASSGRNGQKCEYFKELVKIKDSPEFNLKEILKEENPSAINDKQALTGFAFVEFLLNKGPGYTEKNAAYQNFMWNFVFPGFLIREKGIRKENVWEMALRNPAFPEKVDSLYKLYSLEQTEKELKEWINSQLGPNGEIYAEGVVNPCTCITREEAEKIYGAGN